MPSTRNLAVAALAALLLAPLPAGAAGGNDGGDEKPDCPRGTVARNGRCVRASSGVLPDDELYRLGRAYAKNGYYAEALPILEAVVRTDDSMVYTMRGFALRKLGRTREGLDFYARALALDPNNANTYEYLGEYNVEIGDLEEAWAALARIERICGRECEQYEDLAKAIETGRTE
jgi:tetratricopeptide (TPR) repeat protein